MAGIGDLFGEGSAASQFLLYGVAFAIGQALLQPALEEIRHKVLTRAPVLDLSPEQLADMVIRSIKTEADGATEAARSGINAEKFHDMVLDTGEPPGLETVLAMLRRNIIPEGTGTPGEASFLAAVHTSRLRNEWAAPLLAARLVPITVADAVDAVLRGQISHDQGVRIAYEGGISAEDFQILLDTAGRPPAPMELAEFVRRKLIPLHGTGPDVLSFEQGIFEGDQKDKWEPVFEHLVEYVPPPRSVTALERAGVITAEQAQALYQMNGLTPDLAAAYARDASVARTTRVRQIAESVVLELFEARAITQAEATTHLAALGYQPDDIPLLLKSMELRRELRALHAAQTRIGALYVAHKITRQTVQHSLAALGLPTEAIDHLLVTWDTEAAAVVVPLTKADIEAAYHWQVMTPEEAMTALLHIGMTPYDAWVVLSNRNHARLPNRPTPGPPGPGVNP